MSRKFDVIIVGAGIAGVSTAYYLSKHTDLKIAVVEKDLAASGSTGLAPGILSHQLWHPLDIKLVKRSIEIFKELERVEESNLRFDRTGSLTLFPEDKMDIAEKMLEVQRGVGANIDVFGPEEIKDRYPEMNTDGVEMGTWCPDDGYADPYDFVYTAGRLAMRQGAKFLEKTEVQKIVVEQNKVKGVETNNEGTLEAEKVIIAAGVWSKLLGRASGFDVPVKPYRTQVGVIRLGDKDDLSLLILHDADKDFYYMRSEATQIIAGDGTEDFESNPLAFKRKPDLSFVEKISMNLMERFPSLESASYANGWAGLCSATPDRHPLMGEHREIEGLLFFCGLNGFGVMRAPALGEAFAQDIAGKKGGIDISEYRVKRFENRKEKELDFEIRQGFGF